MYEYVNNKYYIMINTVPVTSVCKIILKMPGISFKTEAISKDKVGSNK